MRDAPLINVAIMTIGSAADLCKKGMIQVMKMLSQESPKTK